MPRFAALAAVFLVGCAHATGGRATLADVDFLGGCWASPDHTTFERWAPTRGKERLGEGYRVKDGAVVFRETIRLEETADGVTYWVTAADQDAVPFKLTQRAANTATFENPDHDYPRTIRYQRNGDALRGWIGDGREERLVLDARLDGCD